MATIKRKNNKYSLTNLGLIAGVGYLAYTFRPKEDNEEEMFLAGGNGSSGVLPSVELGGVTGLTEQQESFIEQALSSSIGDTEIETFTINGQTGSTFTTSKKNRNVFTSQENIQNLGGTNTFVAFTDDTGSIVGGSDFLNMQSVTAERAIQTKKDFSTATNINKRNQEVINRSSSSSSSGGSSSSSGTNFINSLTSGSGSKSSSSSSKSKKETKAELSKKADDRWASVRARYSK